MNNYSMFMPSYSIGAEVYEKIPEICKIYGKTAAVIGGEKAMAAARPYLNAALEKSDIEIVVYRKFGGECTYDIVDENAADERVRAADMIFAVGGGKATDTCKCVAEKLGKPVFSFPTIASNCSCCTSVSIMYNNDGTFLKPHFFKRPPIHAFINTAVIAKSPAQYIWAGMGDTYAKYFEAKISARDEETPHYIALGVQISAMCAEPIIKYGKKALDDNKNGVASFEFEQAVLAVCVTTGLVSILVTRDHTPDYNSGLAHAVFYALTALEEIEKNHLHGEVVAFGVLLLLLADGDYDAFERIYAFNKSVGLPVKAEDIGITSAQLREKFDVIPQMSDIRHYPYKVTRKMLEKAFEYLEEKGKSSV